MTDFEASRTFKRRVARELDFYRTRADISYEELARQIMNDPSAELDAFKRSEYKPLSARSLKELVRGTRNSQKRVVNAVRTFLTNRNGFPRKHGRSLVFDLDPDVVELAIRQASFFGVRNLPANYVSSFEGRYSIVRPQSLMSYDLIVDYIDDLKILLARGNIRYKESPEDLEVRTLFLSGYAVAAINSLTIFLTDHIHPNAYVLELPLKGEFDVKEQNAFFETRMNFLSGLKRGEEGIPFHEAREWPFAYMQDRCTVDFLPFNLRPYDREHFARDDQLQEFFRDIFGNNKFLATEQFRLLIGARSYPGSFHEHITVDKPVKYMVCNEYLNYSNAVRRLFSHSGVSSM